MSDEQIVEANEVVAKEVEATKVLSKADILAMDDLPTKRISIPQWKADVMIRSITASERDQFEQSLFTQKGTDIVRNTENMRAKLCALVLVDEEGNRLFTFNEAYHLGRKSAAALDLIFTEAQKLNGISREDRESLVKNSETDPSEDSTSV